jgi:hypothetical protein
MCKHGNFHYEAAIGKRPIAKKTNATIYTDAEPRRILPEYNQWRFDVDNPMECRVNVVDLDLAKED